MTTSVDLTAGEVMDKAAVLMNDTAKSVFTYTIQIPYLTIALQDLRKKLELTNAPVTDEESAVIPTTAGTIAIGFSTIPALPSDLIEIQQLWERPAGVDPYTPMRRQEFLPHYLEGVEISQFLIWSWEDNQIRVPAANQDIDLKIDYIRNLFTAVTDENSTIGVINADSYLQYRTAALLAEFVGENPTRALSLNVQANDAFETMSGIDNKGKQQIYTRRRPFRAAWKHRGMY